MFPKPYIEGGAPNKAVHRESRCITGKHKSLEDRHEACTFRYNRNYHICGFFMSRNDHATLGLLGLYLPHGQHMLKRHVWK